MLHPPGGVKFRDTKHNEQEILASETCGCLSGASLDALCMR
jgi:hypothetical protein